MKLVGLKSGSVAYTGDLSACLMVLDDEPLAIVCKTFKNKLSDIIKNSYTFEYALEELSVEQCTAVFNAFKDNLPDIIKNSSDFREVLFFLSPEQCTAVCNAVKDNLPNSIENGTAIGHALIHLNSEKPKAVCDAFKDRLHHPDTSWFTYLWNILFTPTLTLTWTTQQSHNDNWPDMVEDWGADNNKGGIYHISSALHRKQPRDDSENGLPDAKCPKLKSH